MFYLLNLVLNVVLRFLFFSLGINSLNVFLPDNKRDTMIQQLESWQFRGGSRIFLGGGALVSCSTSTPINHIVFFFFCRIPVLLENRKSSQGGVRTPCTLPCHFYFSPRDRLRSILGLICGLGSFKVGDHLRYCTVQLASGSELKDYESRHTSEMKITVRQFILEPPQQPRPQGFSQNDLNK